MEEETYSLDDQLAEFRQRPFLATPIAGMIAWFLIGTVGWFSSSLFVKSMSIFVGTGMIVYLAILISFWTGEDFMGRNRRKNIFDTYFFLTVGQAIAVYAIAIPFFLIDRTSLPLTVGILTGLMWIPFSGFIGHWLGYFHAGTRTAAVLALWYAFPEWRFVLIPLAIVLVYLATIALLIQRYRSLQTVSIE